MGQGLETREDVSTSLCPNFARICTSWLWWSVALPWSKMTPYSTVLLVNYWPHCILQQCAAMLAIDHHTNWHGVAKHKSMLAEEPDVHEFQSTPTTVQCSSLVTFGCIIHHSVISAEDQMNESMTLQPLKCDWGMHCLPFSNAADGWWQEKLTMPFGCCSMCGIHFAQTFHSLGCWWRWVKHLLERYWLLFSYCACYTMKHHWHDFELFPSSLQIKYTTQHFESTLLSFLVEAKNLKKSWQSGKPKHTVHM